MAKAQRLQYGVDRIEDGGWDVLEDGDARTFTVQDRGSRVGGRVKSVPSPSDPAQLSPASASQSDRPSERTCDEEILPFGESVAV